MTDSVPEQVPADQDIPAEGRADADADAARAGADTITPVPRYADDGALPENDPDFATDDGTPVGAADAEADAERAGAGDD